MIVDTIANSDIGRSFGLDLDVGLDDDDDDDGWNSLTSLTRLERF